MGPGKHVLDRGAHWHNLANTIEQVMCGSNAVFFFKQKTAYEIRLSLVGSEMCIRDS